MQFSLFRLVCFVLLVFLVESSFAGLSLSHGFLYGGVPPGRGFGLHFLCEDAFFADIVDLLEYRFSSFIITLVSQIP